MPENAALGLIAFSSPNDPEPSLRVEDGRIVELDGKQERADFDFMDTFIANHAIDVASAERCHGHPRRWKIARLLIDPAGDPRRTPSLAVTRGPDPGQGPSTSSS